MPFGFGLTTDTLPSRSPSRLSSSCRFIPFGSIRRFRLRARLGFSMGPNSLAREALPPRSDMDPLTRGPEGLQPS
jgi:hypothetical protein